MSLLRQAPGASVTQQLQAHLSHCSAMQRHAGPAAHPCGGRAAQCRGAGGGGMPCLARCPPQREPPLPARAARGPANATASSISTMGGREEGVARAGGTCAVGGGGRLLGAPRRGDCLPQGKPTSPPHLPRSRLPRLCPASHCRRQGWSASRSPGPALRGGRHAGERPTQPPPLPPRSP